MLIYAKQQVTYPIALEREYAKVLRDYTRGIRDICLEYVPYMADEIIANTTKIDADDDENEEEEENREALLSLLWIYSLTELIKKEMASRLHVNGRISSMFDKVQRFSQNQQDSIFRSVFGGSPQRTPAGTLDELKQVWINQNLSLIESIDSRTVESIQYALSQNVIRTVEKKKIVEELKDTIMRTAEVNENRAALIACDQVGKLNSQLVQYEQALQGVESYIWVTRRDGRVRPAHRARDGQVFRWSEPPSDGHPGWAIRCRCVAKPVYDTDKVGLQPKRGSYKGLSSGSDTNIITETKIKSTKPVDFDNDQAIDTMFSKFTKDFVPNAKKEFAVVVTKENLSYLLEGNIGAVDITKVGKSLRGAKVIHNHPDAYGMAGDCFSREDMKALIEYQLDYLEVASSLGRYRVRYRGKKITSADMYDEYNKAHNEVILNHVALQTKIKYEQLEIMKYLEKTMTGLEFEEIK